MASNIVWGQDIGNSAIKAVKMQRSGTECSIVDFDIIDIPNGDDPADRPARLSAAMKNLTETHKFGNDPVFLAIPGAVCLHREFSLPPSPEARVKEMVQFEARQQIPFPLEQVEWGYERFEAGEDSKALNVTVIAVRKTDIQELLTLAENFNLKLAGIAAAPVALYNFIFYEFKPQTITLILDAGARGTDFVVMNKRQIYFRTIEIAGREITRVLAENKFKVPCEKAESLKKNIEKSPQMDPILTVIEPTLRNLGADVQRTIGFYKAKSRGQKIQQCYLLGHAFRLPRMAEDLQAQVREAPFALVEGLQRIRLGQGVNASVWEHEFPTMAVAIGLGIQGLGLSEMKLNLIPQRKEGDHARQQWKIWATAAAIVLFIALGVSWYLANKQVAEYNGLSEKYHEAVERANKVKEAEAKAVKPIPEKTELISRLSRPGRDRGKIQGIYGKIPGIKGDDGQALFGLHNKMLMTNLYASRAPLSRIPPYGTARFDKVDRSVEYQRLFESFNPGATDINRFAPELHPDAPIVVVVSGEVEVQNNNPGAAKSTMDQLGEALKKLKENRGARVELVYDTEVPVDEHVLHYENNGTLTPQPLDSTTPAIPDEVVHHSVIRFHYMFIWEDPDDKDIVPTPVVPGDSNAAGEISAPIFICRAPFRRAACFEKLSAWRPIDPWISLKNICFGLSTPLWCWASSARGISS